MIPRGLVQLALFLIGSALLAAAIASGVWWNSASILSLLCFLTLLATTTRKATP